MWTGSKLGRYTENGERTRLLESSLGDYSYVVQDCGVWCATIGKFANIAAAVRINATNHPNMATDAASLHLSSLDYWDDAEHETESSNGGAPTPSPRSRHMARPRLDHPARPFTIGDGAAVGAGAVGRRTSRRIRSSAACRQAIRERFDRKTAERYQGARLVGLGPCETSSGARRFPGISAEAFLEKHGG